MQSTPDQAPQILMLNPQMLPSEGSLTISPQAPPHSSKERITENV